MGNGTVVTRSTARMLERRRVTRSGMTRISVFATVAAAIWFSQAGTVGALVGSAFLAAVLFCDATRARMRANRRDALTLWLAAMLSQLREYTVYLGLALGAVSAGINGAWGWAAGALIALALRDSLLVARAAPAAVRAAPVSARRAPPAQRRPSDFLQSLVPFPPEGMRKSDEQLAGRLLGPGSRGAGEPDEGTRAAGDGAQAGGPAAAAQRTRRPEPHRATVPLPALARRIMVFSQPTRFSVIAVTTVAGDARVAFVALIIGCAVAVTGELVDPAPQGGGQ